jgi:hypothetical protein
MGRRRRTPANRPVHVTAPGRGHARPSRAVPPLTRVCRRRAASDAGRWQDWGIPFSSEDAGTGYPFCRERTAGGHRLGFVMGLRSVLQSGSQRSRRSARQPLRRGALHQLELPDLSHVLTGHREGELSKAIHPPSEIIRSRRPPQMKFRHSVSALVHRKPLWHVLHEVDYRGRRLPRRGRRERSRRPSINRAFRDLGPTLGAVTVAIVCTRGKVASRTRPHALR